MSRKQESFEDYLERILMLNKKLEYVRSIDIANDMSFSKPSVSIAMKKLKQAGYINIDENGHISLTDEGLKIATDVLDRHNIISQTLIALGVDEKTAKKDACLIEHDLSPISYEKLKEFYLNTLKK